MKVTIEIEIYEKEPRYLVRHDKDKQVATGNPKALGRAITKLIERASEKQSEAA